jgi:hypothetical protein
MRRSRTAPLMLRNAVIASAPLPALTPYQSCTCGSCCECKENAKWDRVFAKFAVKDYAEERRLFRSPLADL